MITGVKIDYVEAKKGEDGPLKGININISIEGVSAKAGDIEVKYSYGVDYADKLGTLKMSGIAFAKEDAKEAKAISDEWQKTKKLPDGFAQQVLNAISYACGTNGIFPTRVVNLLPPMAPPTINLAKKSKA